MRAGLSSGEIYYGDLVTTTPFENQLHNIELQGKYLREALEFSVADPADLIVLQVSGLKIVYNMTKPAYNRITSLHVLCRVCPNNVPRYEAINDEAFYRVALAAFLSGGGDGFTVIAANRRDIIYGPLDIESLDEYVARNSPLSIPPVTGRISFV